MFPEQPLPRRRNAPVGMQPGAEGARFLDPQTVPYPGPGDIDALTETKTFDATTVGQSFADVFTMPEGYTRIVACKFDPTIGFFVTLKSQRARQDILGGFNTLGESDFLMLGTKDLGDEVLNFTANFYSQGRIAAAVWNGLATVPVFLNALPYKFSFQLIYGR